MKDEGKAIKRRRLVWDELQKKGSVSLSSLNNLIKLSGSKLNKITRPTLYDDIQFLRDFFGHRIEKSAERSDDTTFVLLNNYLALSRHMRSGLNVEKKAIINKILGSLVLAYYKVDYDQKPGDKKASETLAVPPLQSKPELSAPTGNLLLTDNELEEILHKPVAICENSPGDEGGSLVSIARTLKSRIMDMLGYWCRSLRRSLCIDAGSSNELFTTSILCRLQLPMRSLFQMSVWTNNIGAFNALVNPGVEGIEAVTVAGAPQRKRGSIGGYLATKTLEILNPSFGLGIMGCTAIVFENDRVRFGADGDTDAAMKTEFLSKSILRIVVADSSKWANRAYAGYYQFGIPDNQGIHLVITDHVKKEHMLKLLRQGTYVLAASVGD